MSPGILKCLKVWSPISSLVGRFRRCGLDTGSTSPIGGQVIHRFQCAFSASCLLFKTGDLSCSCHHVWCLLPCFPDVDGVLELWNHKPTAFYKLPWSWCQQWERKIRLLMPLTVYSPPHSYFVASFPFSPSLSHLLLNY